MHGRKTGYEANQAETSSASELLLCTQLASDTPSTGRARPLAGQRLKATGLSQAKFARLVDIQVTTLRNREQDRREPTGPAKALLRAIQNDPRHVPPLHISRRQNRRQPKGRFPRGEAVSACYPALGRDSLLQHDWLRPHSPAFKAHWMCFPKRSAPRFDHRSAQSMPTHRSGSTERYTRSARSNIVPRET